MCSTTLPSASPLHILAAMAGVQAINPHAEVTRRAHALSINVSAAVGMQEVLKTNLGEAVRNRGHPPAA